MTIDTILQQYRGLTLAKTTDNRYVVGIGYKPGMTITGLNPRLDYLVAQTLEVAEAFYNQHSKD